MSRHLAALIAALAFIAPALQAQTRPLNDTGITWSGGTTSGNSATCSDSDPAGQDCRHGRDAAAAGTLTKTGASTPGLGGVANGFDYTKIANNGQSLPAGAALGIGPSDWACTRDNVTGLVWEVKTPGVLGLRAMDHTYSWYNSSSPDGSAGTANGGICSLSINYRCDTEKFVQDVNAAGLCGASDWRMPTVKELEGIADLGRSGPAIDPTYFPNTPFSYVWSGSPVAGQSDRAWLVNFYYGFASHDYRNNDNSVRLVRGGQ